MGNEKQMLKMVIAMVLLFLLSGCVSKGGDRGRVVAQPAGGEKVTIQQLTENFPKYDVYYSGRKPSRAVTVLFWPKDGDTTLTPDRWWRALGDQAALSSTVSWMRANAEYIVRPTVQLVIGPNSRLFGYVYSFNFVIETRVVSETELIIYAPVN